VEGSLTDGLPVPGARPGQLARIVSDRL